MKTLQAKLSPEMQLRKKQFTVKTPRVESVSTLIRYLLTVHCIKMPENFTENFKKAYFTHHPDSSRVSILFKEVDAVVFSCNLWKDYLASEDDYRALVAAEICSMAQINCSVIREKYINEQGIKFAKAPPYMMTTIVNSTGGISVYDD